MDFILVEIDNLSDPLRPLSVWLCNEESLIYDNRNLVYLASVNPTSKTLYMLVFELWLTLKRNDWALSHFTSGIFHNKEIQWIETLSAPYPPHPQPNYTTVFVICQFLRLSINVYKWVNYRPSAERQFLICGSCILSLILKTIIFLGSYCYYKDFSCIFCESMNHWAKLFYCWSLLVLKIKGLFP